MTWRSHTWSNATKMRLPRVLSCSWRHYDIEKLTALLILHKGSPSHDDVVKWKHFLRYWPLCGELTGDRWIPLTKARDAEVWCFLWSAWINDWVNYHEAGDLRRHRGHYDVIVMDHGWVPSKRFNNDEFRCCLCCYPKPSGGPTALLQMTLDVTMFVWRHCNVLIAFKLTGWFHTITYVCPPRTI